MLENRNKKVLGKMKDELNGEPLLEFVGQRAKTYAFKWCNVQDEIVEEKRLKKNSKMCCKKCELC